jgi:hypothetical protein
MKFKSLIYRLSVVSYLSILLISCDNSDDVDVKPIYIETNLNKLIIDKNWRLSECYSYPIIDNDSSVFDKIENCLKDNIFKYNIDGTYVVQDQELKCNNSDPDMIKGIWQIKNDTLHRDNQRFKINFINDRKMQLVYSINAGNNQFIFKYIYS